MPSGIIVAVKTKPYLRDYIVKKYGSTEPVKATISNKLFPMLSRYLSKKPIGWRPPEAGNDTLLFELPYTTDRFLDTRNYCFINPDHFTEINSFLYGMFYCDFTEFVNNKCIKLKWGYRFAIINFMEVNEISFDKIEYDSLKRLYYRYRKQFSNDENKFFTENSKNILPSFQGKKIKKVPAFG
jgi:hypothetical protein